MFMYNQKIILSLFIVLFGGFFHKVYSSSLVDIDNAESYVILSNRSPIHVPYNKIFSQLNPKQLLVIFPKETATEDQIDQLKELYGELMPVGDYLSSGNVEWEIMRLANRHPVRKIIALSEPDVLRAAEFRDFLKITGQSYHDALAFRDKIIMKEYVARAGIKVPRYATAKCVVDVLEFGSKIGFPIVIKPSRGTGSMNTYVLKSNNSNQWPETLKNSFSCDHYSEFVVEEFIDGPLYAVNGIVKEGQLIAAWPSKYIGTNLGFLFGKSFGNYILEHSNPEVAKLNMYAESILNSLPKLVDGVFHLELFENKGDYVFCEIAARTAGGHHRQEWISAFDIDMGLHHLIGQAGLSVSKKMNLPLMPMTIPSFLYIPPQPGTLVQVPDSCPFPWVKEYKVNYEVGMSMGSAKYSCDPLAYIFLESDSEEQAKERLMAVSSWFESNTIIE